MAKFKFYQDRKIITWERTFVEVEANSEEEALNKLHTLKKSGFVYESDDEGLRIDRSEILYENMEDMTVTENNGQATIQTYNSRKELLFDNKCSALITV